MASERSTHNLRKVQRVVANGIEDEILKLVDDAKEIFAQGSHDEKAAKQAASLLCE